MYRVFLSIVLVATCASLPIAGPRSQQATNQADPDVVDSLGGGYSFFHNQNIDIRPTTSQFVDIPAEYLEDYSESSAFEQPLIPISRNTLQTKYPSTTSNQIYYQSQPQQKTFVPQLNYANQQYRPMRNQQRPLFNTASNFGQYPSQSFTPAMHQPIYADGW